MLFRSENITDHSKRIGKKAESLIIVGNVHDESHRPLRIEKPQIFLTGFVSIMGSKPGPSVIIWLLAHKLGASHLRVGDTTLLRQFGGLMLNPRTL